MSKKKKTFLSSFRTRSFRVGGYSVIATAIVLAIIIAANVLIGALPTAVTELDITAEGLYSLSQQSENLLKNLDTDVTIYWITQSGQEDTVLEGLLARYTSGSSHVKLKKIDPDLNPTFIKAYTGETLNNNSLVVESALRFRYVDYYDIYLESIDYETYNYVYDFDGENAVTSAIDYVIAQDLPKVYALTGHGEIALDDTFRRAMELDNFQTSNLNITTATAIPQDAGLVLILVPTSDYTAGEVAVLSEYMDRGGDVMLVTTPTETQVLVNLEGLMAGYGISTVDGVVFEGDSANSYYGYPHYLCPNVLSHTITDPIADARQTVLLPEAHGLQIASQLPEKVTATVLLETSSDAYSKTGAWPLVSSDKEEGDLDGPFAIGVAATRSLSDSVHSNVVWISSAQLLNSEVSTAISGGNLDLFMNSVNWLCEHESRISIRAKNNDLKYLTIRSSSAATMTILVVAVIPACFLAAGVIIFVRRKRK